MPYTRQNVVDLIQARWEDTNIPDKVIEALRPYHGKMVTTRLLDKLPGGRDQWYLRREYGMTALVNHAYRFSQGSDRDGICLTMAHTEKSFELDIAHLERENPAYFSARKKRNYLRMEACDDTDKLDKMAAVLNRIDAARIQLEQARAEFEELTEYGSVFDPDKYELERACGLDAIREGERHVKRNKAA